MSNEYAKELELIREATRKFGAFQKAYHAMEIGDAEFLAARAEYKAAESRFDAAYAKG